MTSAYKTYGAVESHCASALACLVTSSARDAQMGLDVRSDWLLQLPVKGILHAGEQKKRASSEVGHS